MKTIFKACTMLALVAILGSSCSVERKTRDGKKNVIDVGINRTEYKNSQASIHAIHSGTIAVAA